MLAFMGLGNDALRLNPAQQVALPYRYSLAGWEAGNLLSKWVHRLATAFPWSARSAEDRRATVFEYFRLGAEIGALNARLERAAAATDDGAGESPTRLEAELAELLADRRKLRNDVEEEMEATVSAVLAEADISSWGEFIFPPVDIRLDRPPKLLVTSPRDRILRSHDVLLDPNLSVQQSETLERALYDDWGLSALVTELGGVATYPSSVVDSLPLGETLRIASHEWLHQYLAFQPLGRRIFKSSEMQTLNETFGDIAAREMGERAHRMLGGPPSATVTGGKAVPEAVAAKGKDEFDFAAEMRETRRRVDDLLAGGAINEAEAYMEERRKLFVANGSNIRKLNQAYFAFHGTYAESPASVSPIADQLHQLRDQMPGLKEFVATMSKISSYAQFLDTLERIVEGSEG